MIEKWRESIINELSEALEHIDPQQFDELVNGLLQARRILCIGVGRVLISMKAWVKRLKHFDLDINYVGAETEEPIGKGDMLLVTSASGESLFPVAIAKKAKELGVRVAYIGCTRDSSIDVLADQRLYIKGRTKFSSPGEDISIQPMSTLFEQQLMLLGDMIALEIMARRGWLEEDIKYRHANME